MKSRAFTLIEILVTIAIIGILAAIIIVGIQSSRTKAKNDAVKSAFTKARLEVNDANYATVFTSDQMCRDAISNSYMLDLKNNGAALQASPDDYIYCKVGDGAYIGKWMIYTQVNGTGGGKICYDSAGNVGKDQTLATIFWNSGAHNPGCTPGTPTL